MILMFIDDSDGPGERAMFGAKVDWKILGKENPQNMSSLDELIVKAHIRLAGRKISALRIIDHGLEETTTGDIYITIGKDEIGPKTFDGYKAKLAMLKGKFQPWGFVHLFNCNAGRTESTLRRLARLWGVPVFATRGNYDGVTDKSDDIWVVARPDGAFQYDVKRPSVWSAMLDSSRAR